MLHMRELRHSHAYLHMRGTFCTIITLLQISVVDPDPGSSALLTPGSRIRDGWKISIRIRDYVPDHISESLETIFGLKILWCSSGSGIRDLFDPGSRIKKFGSVIRDKFHVFVTPQILLFELREVGNVAAWRAVLRIRIRIEFDFDSDPGGQNDLTKIETVKKSGIPDSHSTSLWFAFVIWLQGFLSSLLIQTGKGGGGFMTPVKSTPPAPEQRTIKIIACSRVTKPANIQVLAYRFPFYSVILVLIDICKVPVRNKRCLHPVSYIPYRYRYLWNIVPCTVCKCGTGSLVCLCLC